MSSVADASDFIPASKRELKERKYTYSIDLTFRGFQWNTEVPLRTLQVLNKRVAPSLPGYLQFSFPPRKHRIRNKSGFSEKRRALLERWLNDVLAITIDVGNILDELVEVLRIPPEAAVWIRRDIALASGANRSDAPAGRRFSVIRGNAELKTNTRQYSEKQYSSTGPMLFVDLFTADRCEGSGTDSVADLQYSRTSTLHCIGDGDSATGGRVTTGPYALTAGTMMPLYIMAAQSLGSIQGVNISRGSTQGSSCTSDNNARSGDVGNKAATTAKQDTGCYDKRDSQLAQQEFGGETVGADGVFADMAICTTLFRAWNSFDTTLVSDTWENVAPPPQRRRHGRGSYASSSASTVPATSTGDSVTADRTQSTGPPEEAATVPHQDPMPIASATEAGAASAWAFPRKTPQPQSTSSSPVGTPPQRPHPRTRMCPIYVERIDVRGMYMAVHALHPVLTGGAVAQMCVDALHAGVQNLPPADAPTVRHAVAGVTGQRVSTADVGQSSVHVQAWSLFERRIVANEGIYERPFGDNEPIARLWRAKRFPELRCRQNTSKLVFDQQRRVPEMMGALLHRTTDAGWQRIFARCTSTAGGVPPRLECYKDSNLAHKLGFMVCMSTRLAMSRLSVCVCVSPSMCAHVCLRHCNEQLLHSFVHSFQTSCPSYILCSRSRSVMCATGKELLHPQRSVHVMCSPSSTPVLWHCMRSPLLFGSPDGHSPCYDRGVVVSGLCVTDLCGLCYRSHTRSSYCTTRAP